MTTFCDLFCGGGTATKGLVDAGLTHVHGFDSWEPAVNNMRANGRCATVADVTEMPSIPAADVVWASPPCTEYSSGSNHRAKREHVKDLVLDAARLAITASPSVVVLENHPLMLKADQYKQAISMLANAGLHHVREYVVDAANYGSPSHRKRCFVTISRNDIGEIDWGKQHSTSWDQVINPVWDGDWRTTGHSSRMAAKLGSSTRCLYNYYSSPTASREGQPARTITTVPRSVAIHSNGARYWLRSEDYRKLMGLPDDFTLVGNERDRCKIIGNGVAFASSLAIGKHLIKVL